MHNDLDHLDDDMTDEQADELNREYKIKTRETIERFGGLERAKSILEQTGNPLSEVIVMPLQGEGIPAFELQQFVYAYLMIGLDNPIGLTIKGMNAGIRELTRNRKILNESDLDCFSFAYSSLILTTLDGREYTYEIEDFIHMKNNLENKLKKDANNDE